jgi:hypothetical protein
MRSAAMNYAVLPLVSLTLALVALLALREWRVCKARVHSRA